MGTGGGKFVRDANGKIVSMNGAPIMMKEIGSGRSEKKLKRHKRCDKCGFNQYEVGDVTFIVQNMNIGRLMYLCPECAVRCYGLPMEHYIQNRNSPGLPQQQQSQQQSSQQFQYIPKHPSTDLVVQQCANDCTTVSRTAMYNSSDILACLCLF